MLLLAAGSVSGLPKTPSVQPIAGMSMIWVAVAGDAVGRLEAEEGPVEEEEEEAVWEPPAELLELEHADEAALTPPPSTLASSLSVEPSCISMSKLSSSDLAVSVKWRMSWPLLFIGTTTREGLLLSDATMLFVLRQLSEETSLGLKTFLKWGGLSTSWSLLELLRWFIIFEGLDVGKRVTQRRALKCSLALGGLVGKEEEKKIKCEDEVKRRRGTSVALGKEGVC